MSVVSVEDVRAVAQGLGFAMVGVAPARASAFEAYVRQWLDNGTHGQMGYLAQNVAARLDPRKLLAGAVSVICVADRYPPDAPEASEVARAGGEGAKGRIARYAWGDDYHRIMKKRLFALADTLRERYPDYEYKSTVDTAPVMEREHAQRAGLGWVGKHTLLIHPRLGSWLLLGEVVTTLPIRCEESLPATAASVGLLPEGSHCGTCTRCIDACPTECIGEYELDAKRCISYLTLEHRDTIDTGLQQQMGDWVAGCDVCQEVCPYNHGHGDGASDRSGEYHPRYTARPPGPAVGLMQVLAWDEAARREAFRNSALKRVKLDMLKRNALIAAGNYLTKHRDGALHEWVRQLAGDEGEPELVRKTAQQVLTRLAPA